MTIALAVIVVALPLLPALTAIFSARARPLGLTAAMAVLTLTAAIVLAARLADGESEPTH